MAQLDILRIAAAQLNPCVGDISGNVDLVRSACSSASDADADLVIFSELFLSGYPPEDLIQKPSFVDCCERAISDLASDTKDGPGILIGVPWRDDSSRDIIYNSVLLLDGGEVVAVRHKVDLPNYGVFDEKRLFVSGEIPGPVNFRGVRLGVPICEDIWGDLGICETLSESGAEILIVLNGSPYHHQKHDIRCQVVLRQIIESGLPVFYLNQTGGQDELVFDGGSFAMNTDKSVAVQLPHFEDSVEVTTWRRGSDGWRCDDGIRSGLVDCLESDWLACVTGLRDYASKNGFADIVLGLSGGIDSAVCAALAVDALGSDSVRCVMMPYTYTSESSLSDAESCANILGVRYDVIPIAPPVDGFGQALGDLFSGLDSDVTEENLQSRVRGTLLMALSNKFGSLLVTTGNKSEMSVGYATLYGDMNGGFNPIKDIYKTEVYSLARWRNEHCPASCYGPSGVVIPPSIIEKAPSAELREGQLDSDSLPPYEILDKILEGLIEDELSPDEVSRRHNIDSSTVIDIERLLYSSEYKRRQAAPGVKVTRRSFGRERRYPITHRFGIHRR